MQSTHGDRGPLPVGITLANEGKCHVLNFGVVCQWRIRANLDFASEVNGIGVEAQTLSFSQGESDDDARSRVRHRERRVAPKKSRLFDNRSDDWRVSVRHFVIPPDDNGKWAERRRMLRDRDYVFCTRLIDERLCLPSNPLTFAVVTNGGKQQQRPEWGPHPDRFRLRKDGMFDSFHGGNSPLFAVTISWL